MSSGGPTPGGTLGVGGFEFDDASPKSPLRPISFVGTDSITSPALAAEMVRLGMMPVAGLQSAVNASRSTITTAPQ